jgi:hypothetical protein
LRAEAPRIERSWSRKGSSKRERKLKRVAAMGARGLKWRRSEGGGRTGDSDVEWSGLSRGGQIPHIFVWPLC